MDLLAKKGMVILLFAYCPLTISDKSEFKGYKKEPILVDQVIDSLNHLQDIAKQIKIEERNLKKLRSGLLEKYDSYRECLEKDGFPDSQQSFPDFTREATFRLNMMRHHLSHRDDIHFDEEEIYTDERRIMEQFNEMDQQLQLNVPSPRAGRYRITLGDLQCIQGSSSMNLLHGREYLTPLKVASEVSRQCRGVEMLGIEINQIQKSIRNQIRDLRKLWKRFFKVLDENRPSIYNEMD